MSAFLITAFRSDMIARFQKSGIYVRRFHKKRLYAPSPSIFGHLSPFCPSFNDHINRSTTGNNNKSPKDESFVSVREEKNSFVLWVVGIAGRDAYVRDFVVRVYSTVSSSYYR